MTAVDKIEHAGYRFSLRSNEDHVIVAFTDMAIPGNRIVSVKQPGIKLLTVWLCVTEFIKWYNENKS
jgi:hypothetical protein